MENEQTMNAIGAQDGYIMKPVDQISHSKGRYDILTRRLKNRERQRRYRARKRLEAVTRKSFVVKETPPVQIQVQPVGIKSSFVTRKYCNRKWKKDAREAQIPKNQTVIPNVSVATSLKLTVDPFDPCMASERKCNVYLVKEVQSGSSIVVCNSETPRVVFGGRNWKEEARKKKISFHLSPVNNLQ